MAEGAYEPFPPVEAWASVAFDPATYAEYAALLDDTRQSAPEAAREQAVRTAIRYAGTDTGAIEGLYATDRGFTRTVAIEAAHWEAAANERGPNAAALIKDQIEAYEWLLDLATQRRPVTEAVIRELHAILCRSQDTYTVHTDLGTQERPLPKGEYKKFPNNPTSLATGKTHYYAPVELVPAEVHRLVESLTSPEYVGAHPVIQAAYLHYSFVAIHPFADGNGRTTRALASVPLYRDVRVPFVVFRDQRDEYLDALGAADQGDVAPFVSFVQDRVLDAIDLVRNSIRYGGLRGRETAVSTIEDAMRVSGFLAKELDAIGGRVRDEVAHALEAHVADPAWPEQVQATAYAGRGPNKRGKAPEGYRWPQRDLPASLGLTAGPPARAGVTLTSSVALAIRDGVAPILVTTERDDVPDLELLARDVAPQLREVTRIKIADWTGAVVDVALRELAEAAKSAREHRDPEPSTAAES